MSNDALNWAWKTPIADSTAVFVLVVLADHAGDCAGEDWTCYPAVDRIMARTRKSRSAVERSLKWLEAEGYISRQRRRLPGGRLGIYDYVLHRERNLAASAFQAEVDPASHASKRRVDHASEQPPTMRQNGASPYGVVTHVDEPSVEPSDEPSLRARGREQGQVWGAEVWRAWPSAGQDASSPQLTDEAMETVLGRGADPAEVMAGVRGYIADRKAWGASGRPLSPHRFLAEGRWKTFADRTPGGPGGLHDGARRAFEDAEVRAEFLAETWESGVRSYLDPATWDEASRTIHPRNGISADWLKKHWPTALTASGVRLGDVRKVEQ